MKKRIAVVIMLLMILTLAGCGSNSSPNVFVTQILSDPAIDGDIALDTVNNVDIYTITQGTSPVYAGIDPQTLTEYRAFLHFSLEGTGGVPLSAAIASAKLDIFINNIQPLIGTIPISIDLVTFPPPTLIASDFDTIIQPALSSISKSISQSDLGKHVVFDVTALMREAQFRGLPDFQIRIMEPLGLVSPGRIEIDDTTAARAPQLEVTYY